jgi:hypothetical protein
MGGYLYLKIAKPPCFSFYLCFFFYKTREQEGETDSAWGWGGKGGWAPVEGESMEDEYGANNVYICMYMQK